MGSGEGECAEGGGAVASDELTSNFTHIHISHHV